MSNTIINNSATNYSQYYNVLDYFKEIMQNHPSIGHVSNDDVSVLDGKEYPKYPLGNIIVTEAVFSGTTTQWGIQLIVADKIKNKNNENENQFNKQIIPFFGVDDTVDIHANTFGILNDLTSFTQRSVEAFDITDDITLTPFSDRFNNGLAGWLCEFTLIAHNDRNRCLFNLLPNG
jgi:hypothetical protein